MPDKNELTPDKSVSSYEWRGGRMVKRSADKVLNSEFGGDWTQYNAVVNDSQVRASMTNRKSALQSIDGRFVVSDEVGSPERAEELQIEVNEVFDNIDGFEESMAGMADAIVLGFKVGEVIWDTDGSIWKPVDLIVRPNKLFDFTADEQSLVYYPEGSWQPSNSTVFDDEKYKFVVWSHDASDNNRKGNGLGQSLFWFVWFKSNAYRFHNIFAEKFGMPTVLGQVENAQDIAELQEILEDIINQTAITFSGDKEIKYLEPQRYSTTNVFGDIITSCNNEISKLIEGAAAISGETTADGTGSFALSKQLDDQFLRIIQHDSKYDSRIRTQIARWYLETNYGADIARNVEFVRAFDTEKMTMTDKANLLKTIGETGAEIELSTKWMRDAFNLPAPVDEEDAVTIGGAAAGGVEPFATPFSDRKYRSWFSDFFGIPESELLKMNFADNPRSLPEYLREIGSAGTDEAQPEARAFFERTTKKLQKKKHQKPLKR
jgi:phage gp29-like protein